MQQASFYGVMRNPSVTLSISADLANGLCFLITDKTRLSLQSYLVSRGYPFLNTTHRLVKL